MCGWINNNVHIVFTLLLAFFVFSPLEYLFMKPATLKVFTSFHLLLVPLSSVSSLCFLPLRSLLPLNDFLTLLPCFHSPLSWYSSYRSGPEPPTNIVFSKVTEDSLTVSWTKPKSAVSGFKVTYTHTDDGEHWHSNSNTNKCVDTQNSPPFSLLFSTWGH